jgi:membrane associated rhomboid family serine protease
VPDTRTVFGGKVRQGKPVVTYLVMVTCLLVFALEYVKPLNLLDRWDLVPAYTAHQPWRLLTSAVMHSTDMPLHIVMNLYCLYLLGPPLEYALGRWRYALSCLLCALGGSAGFIAIAGGFVIDGGVRYLTSAIGASGMVFGLFGIMLAVQRRLRRDLRGLLVVIAINLALPLLMAGVAWQGHLGGLVTGLACGAALAGWRCRSGGLRPSSGWSPWSPWWACGAFQP